MRPAIRFGSRARLGPDSGAGAAGGAPSDGAVVSAARAARALPLGEPETAAVDFLDVAPALEVLQDSRKKAPAAVPQLHAMSNLTDAGRLRQRGQVSEDFSSFHVGVARFFLFDCVL